MRIHIGKFLMASTVVGVVVTASLQAQAERRHLGLFDSSYRPIQVEVDVPIGKAQVLSSGHLPGAVIEFPDRTRSRTGLRDQMPMDQQRKIVIPRVAKALKRLESESILPLVKRISRIYNVDPAAVLSALVGELTFNNEAQSYAQDFVSAGIPSFMNFSGAARVASMFDEPALRACQMERSDYWSWTCANRVWSTSLYLAKSNPAVVRANSHSLLQLSPKEETLHGVLRPKTGTSYGPGQLSLAQLLMVSADISAHSNLPRITIDKMAEGLALIKTYDGTVHVIAAGMARSIAIYKRFAGYDISKNIGVLATLFNLGRDFEFATALRAENLKRQKQGLPAIGPRENYFGFYMNEFEPQIRALLAKAN